LEATTPAQRRQRRLTAAVAFLKSSADWLRAFLYGATGYEFEREAARIRADLENLFVFMIIGDTLGIPVMPPYYALRLLPYLQDVAPSWRRRMLRERHPLDSEEFDLHGL